MSGGGAIGLHYMDLELLLFVGRRPLFRNTSWMKVLRYFFLHMYDRFTRVVCLLLCFSGCHGITYAKLFCKIQVVNLSIHYKCYNNDIYISGYASNYTTIKIQPSMHAPIKES